MPEEIKEVTTEATQVAPATETKEAPSTGKVKFRGRELEESDADYLMAKGLEAHQRELAAAEAEATTAAAAATETIDAKTAQEIADLRKELRKTQTEIQRTRMTDQMTSLVNEFKITKEDPEMAQDVADLALLQLSKSSEQTTLRECFINQIKKLEKRGVTKVAERVKEKTETKEKTQGAGKGASTGPDAAPKLTGKDLLNGGVRKSVDARMKAGGRGVFK